MVKNLWLVWLHESIDEIIVSIVQEISQISYVYIFCENKSHHEKAAKEWFNVKGVYRDIILICAALEQTAQDCDQNSVSISFVKTTDGTSNQNLGKLDQSFTCAELLKKILLTINLKQMHINEFLTYCRAQLAGNNVE